MQILPCLLLSHCVLAWASVLIAQPERTPADKVDLKSLNVQFTKGAVVVNGTKLTLPIQRKELFRLLGTPNRETKLANTILTWDELGIHAYQIPKTEKVRALQITLAREAFPFSPKKVFTGTMKVEGVKITAMSNIESINRAIKPAAFVKARACDDVWRLPYKDSVLYLKEADPKTRSDKVLFTSLQFDQKESD